jgi:predicted nucleic acid-binding Zn ribbon protein
MPIYVYERPDGSRFEIRQSFNDPHLTEDPETGVPVRRVLQPAPIIFKGSGWYKTDSRATAAPKVEAPAAVDGAEKAADKPAEKSETTSAKEAVSEATAKTTDAIKKAEKPATPAAAS